MLTFVFRHPLILARGLALVALGLYLGWRKHTLLLTGRMADGEVLELIPHRGSKGGTNYSSRVAFTQSDGSKAEFTTSYSSSPPMHALHEKVRVVYYPGNANSASPDILAFADLFLFPWICVCVGFCILLVCAGLALGPGLIDSFYPSHLSGSNPLAFLKRPQ